MKGIGHILQDLTVASGSRISNQVDIKGRMKRTPSYTRGKVSSTRPRSDTGVTFHFAHKTISKRSSISDSNRFATASAAHQGYIERNEAVCHHTEQATGQVPSYPSNPMPNHPASEKFAYPGTSADTQAQSFGTLGISKADRINFWTKVEVAEGRTGRIQSRIIAELPHEVTDAERYTIARTFCHELEKRSLPYWAAIHEPSHRNDGRNYHLHIAYLDRPATMSDNGLWDFEVTETHRKKNRTRVQRRPLKQNKSDEVRDRGWVKKLRLLFSECSNATLARSGSDKRLDPRSYRESGIGKAPTEHLGSKSSAQEKMGLDTERGWRNTRREAHWKLSKATQRWDDAEASLDLALMLSSGEKEADVQTRQHTRSLIGAGRKNDLRAAQMSIIADLVGNRIVLREDFLAAEAGRISRNQKERLRPENQMTMLAIIEELEVIRTRFPSVKTIADHCRTEQATASGNADAIWTRHIGPGLAPVAGALSLPAHDRTDQVAKDIMPSVTDTAREARNVVEASPRRQGTDLPLPPLDAVAAVHHEKLDPSSTWLPGSMPIPPIVTYDAVRALDRKLLSMSNHQVRTGAIMSRDSVDLMSPGNDRSDVNRGWVILRSEAQRRGLDLETGLQDLAVATDPQRARIHRDQREMSVIAMKQELIEVQVR